MASIDSTLKQFDAVEANLVKLERLWKKIFALLPSPNSVSGVEDEATYREHARTFSRIVSAMPTIDGYALADVVPDADSVLSLTFDVQEIGEFEAQAGLARSFAEQGDVLAEYRFRLASKRREMARKMVRTLAQEIDTKIQVLSAQAARKESSESMKGAAWEDLNQLVRSIDVVLGSSVSRPKGWNALRKLHQQALKATAANLVVP